MKKVSFLMLLIFTASIFCSSQLFANEYTDETGHKFLRGFKNVTSCFVEVPIAIKGEKEGRPVIRQTKATLIGLGKMLLRLGSGVLDIVVSPIPKCNGLPVDPETRF